MDCERLRSWQPGATEEQLEAFAREHRMLLNLLDESWQKFKNQCPELFQAAPAAPVSRYAEGYSVEDLAHFPVSNAELAAFLEVFDRERRHDDRPFGDDVEIVEQDWEIE